MTTINTVTAALFGLDMAAIAPLLLFIIFVRRASSKFHARG